LTGNFQSTLASKREVIRFSKFNEDRKLRVARGLQRSDTPCIVDMNSLYRGTSLIIKHPSPPRIAVGP